MNSRGGQEYSRGVQEYSRDGQEQNSRGKQEQSENKRQWRVCWQETFQSANKSAPAEATIRLLNDNTR